MSNRPLRVYRLDVTYPPGSRRPGWQPAGWESRWAPGPIPDGEADYFRWPAERRFLSRSGAMKRAALLRSYGAEVTVVASDPVTWPGEDGTDV